VTSASQQKPIMRPTVLMSRKQQPIWSLKNDDDRLIIIFVVLSIVGHSLFFVLEGFDLFDQKDLVINEWVMDAEIVSEVDFAGLEKSAVPDAKIAEEAKVRETLLPQLTKTFSVKEDTKPEDVIAEEKEKVEEKIEDKKEAEKPEKTEDLQIKTQNKEDNKLDQRDAAKRLAMDRLKALNKTAKTNEAEVSSKDDVATKILQNLKGGIAGGSARGKQIIDQYVGMVRRAVQSNYSLPEAYNLKGAVMQVTIVVVVSERGDLMKVEVDQSSGDNVFDNMTLDSVKASAPLPKPPQELVGEKIFLVFKP
jgi:TolA protein